MSDDSWYLGQALNFELSKDQTVKETWQFKVKKKKKSQNIQEAEIWFSTTSSTLGDTFLAVPAWNTRGLDLSTVLVKPVGCSICLVLLERVNSGDLQCN